MLPVEIMEKVIDEVDDHVEKHKIAEALNLKKQQKTLPNAIIMSIRDPLEQFRIAKKFGIENLYEDIIVNAHSNWVSSKWKKPERCGQRDLVMYLLQCYGVYLHDWLPEFVEIDKAHGHDDGFYESFVHYHENDSFYVKMPLNFRWKLLYLYAIRFVLDLTGYSTDYCWMYDSFLSWVIDEGLRENKEEKETVDYLYKAVYERAKELHTALETDKYDDDYDYDDDDVEFTNEFCLLPREFVNELSVMNSQERVDKMCDYYMSKCDNMEDWYRNNARLMEKIIGTHWGVDYGFIFEDKDWMFKTNMTDDLSRESKLRLLINEDYFHNLDVDSVSEEDSQTYYDMFDYLVNSYFS